MKTKIKKMLCLISSLFALAGSESFAFSLPEAAADFRKMNLTEQEFKSLFQEGGIFRQRKYLIFSNRSFQGHWIQYLPIENLNPEEDGTARLYVETSTGAIFRYWGKDPELGHSWLSPPTQHYPNGLILFDRFGYVLSKDLANFYCNQRNAILPEIEDFKDLGRFFGAKYTDTYQDSTQYSPQIIAQMEHEFWSLSPDGLVYVWSFFGNSGFVYNGSQNVSRQVLCIRDATPRIRPL